MRSSLTMQGGESQIPMETRAKLNHQRMALDI
jgi:hypothetical protein